MQKILPVMLKDRVAADQHTHRHDGRQQPPHLRPGFEVGGNHGEQKVVGHDVMGRVPVLAGNFPTKIDSERSGEGGAEESGP